MATPVPYHRKITRDQRCTEYRSNVSPPVIPETFPTPSPGDIYLDVQDLRVFHFTTKNEWLEWTRLDREIRRPGNPRCFLAPSQKSIRWYDLRYWRNVKEYTDAHVSFFVHKVLEYEAERERNKIAQLEYRRDYQRRRRLDEAQRNSGDGWLTDTTIDTEPHPHPDKSQTVLRHPSRSALTRLVYLLALLAVHLASQKTDGGAQGDRALGRPRLAPDRPTQPGSPLGIFRAGERERSGGADDKIKDLTAALGVPSNDLASAVVGAVHPSVPESSASVPKAEGTPVEVLLGERDDM